MTEEKPDYINEKWEHIDQKVSPFRWILFVDLDFLPPLRKRRDTAREEGWLIERVAWSTTRIILENEPSEWELVDLLE